MIQTLILLVICLPWLGALLVWWAGDSRPRLQHGLAVVFSAAAGVAAIALIPNTVGKEAARLPLPAGGVFGWFSFTPDGLGVFLTAVAAVIGCLAVVFSVDYMRGEAQLGRYYAFVLLFIGSMTGLVLTSNMLLMFVFWEMTALCSYALISFYNDDPKAVAGGMKALIITQVGGVGLLLGAILGFAYLGSLNVDDFLQRAHLLPTTALTVAAFGFLIAAAAKSAQFPFQTWLPDAMEAPTPCSALIHAATMVNAGVYLLARFYPAFENVPYWRLSVMVVGMLSALLAALMALAATDLKRVLAYSTVSQLGYMVYAVGAGGIFASQFHLLSHSVFKALLFLAAGAVIHGLGTRDMLQMGGLGKKMPVARAVFVIGAAALAGLPILNGFWSKELVLEAGLEHGPAWIYAVMLFVAGLTALYTFRCVWMVFYGAPRSTAHAHDAGGFMRAALYPLAFGTLTTWLLAGPFSQMLHDSLPQHSIHTESTGEVALVILTAPATYLALAVVGLGLLAWWQRERLALLSEPLQDVIGLARNSFGFEAINRGIVSGVQSWAENLRDVQTGLLNWNIVGILAGLITVLVIVALGA
ncbi:MAG: NADH-quinone oxidoreductase subunit L [Chloroflexi bacterium]|nr:NADH-quinone oxidoreductase subunit L [Chloroflexota bacterium]